MSLKIIGAGFGRTGTLSMKVALEQLLGGRCYHMETIVKSQEQFEHWYAWAKDPVRPPNWDAILDGFVAAVDAPICYFTEELMALYPDAKVLLTVRDPDTWVKSFKALMMTNIKRAWMGLFSSRHRRFGTFGRTMGRLYIGSLKNEALIETFVTHNQRIRDLVPTDRLLEMEVKDGWQPLCEFLEVPVPECPFPRLNEGLVTVRKSHWYLAYGRKEMQ